jgi:hypothetical protein
MVKVLATRLPGLAGWNRRPHLCNLGTGRCHVALGYRRFDCYRLTWRQLISEKYSRRVENLERQVDNFEGERYRSVRARLAKLKCPQGVLERLDLNDPPSEVYETLDFLST